MSEEPAPARPHRSIRMPTQEPYTQIKKSDVSEIFTTEGWKKLTIEDAQVEALKGKHVYGVYDPMGTVASTGNSDNSARVVVQCKERFMPNDYKTHK
jgi:hypothetical protein